MHVAAGDRGSLTDSTPAVCVRYPFLDAAVGVPSGHRPDRMLPLRPARPVPPCPPCRALRVRNRDGEAAQPPRRRLLLPRHAAGIGRLLRRVLPRHERAPLAGSTVDPGAAEDRGRACRVMIRKRPLPAHSPVQVVALARLSTPVLTGASSVFMGNRAVTSR